MVGFVQRPIGLLLRASFLILGVGTLPLGYPPLAAGAQHALCALAVVALVAALAVLNRRASGRPMQTSRPAFEANRRETDR